MAVRIQLRRDTAANWVSNNPTLREGELGIETDTLKIKVGTGAAWNSTSNYANVVPSDFNTTLGDYVLVSDIGGAGGVVGLNNDLNAIIPGSSIIIEGSTDNANETTLIVTDPTADRTITFPDATGTVALTSDLNSYAALSGATFTGNINLPTAITFEGATADSYETTIQATDPTEDRTITIPDATGTLALTSNIPSTTDGLSEGSTNKYFTDERAQDATAAALAAGTHTNITVTYDDNGNSISLAAAPGYTDEEAQDAVGNSVGNGLDYDDASGAISVDPSEFALSAVGVPTANISLNSYKITNLASPESATDAANKAYVDNITAGLNFHSAVHAATTGNLTATYDNTAKTLTGSGAFPTIDGETILETERVLVKSQSDAKENGLYTLTDDGDPSGSWVLTRAADADNTPTGEIAYGDFVFVQTGTTNGGYGFIMTTTGTITLGTSNINWTQFNAGQTVIAGNGLTETSPGTLAIDTTITQTRVSGVSDTEIGYLDGVTSAIQTQINSKSPTEGNTSLVTLGTVTTGTWSATAIGVTKGGTGLTSISANQAVYGSGSNTITAGTLPIAAGGTGATTAMTAATALLPSQTSNSGKYLTNDGAGTLSWATVSGYSAPTLGSTSIASGATVTSIAGLTLNATSTTSITANTATTVDTNALSGFTTLKYVVSIKQGSKIRSSEIVAQTDGTSVDYTEFGIVETGGTMTGILAAVSVSSTNAVLQVTITDAASTNATVKIHKVLI